MVESKRSGVCSLEKHPQILKILRLVAGLEDELATLSCRVTEDLAQTEASCRERLVSAFSGHVHLGGLIVGLHKLLWKLGWLTRHSWAK